MFFRFFMTEFPLIRRFEQNQFIASSEEILCSTFSKICCASFQNFLIFFSIIPEGTVSWILSVFKLEFLFGPYSTKICNRCSQNVHYKKWFCIWRVLTSLFSKFPKKFFLEEFNFYMLYIVLKTDHHICKKTIYVFGVFKDF